jgi:endonuclease-3
MEKEKALNIIKKLSSYYGPVEAELDYKNSYELTIAVVLSAQTTDKQVNKATPALFAKYPDFATLGKAPLKEIETLIHSTGFYKNKAKNIIALGQALENKELPDTIEELIKLPGIGRKTANVIISQGFDKPGFAVDTHVGRITQRLGMTMEEKPEKIEMDMKQLLPDSLWLESHLLFITHGRRICTSRSPKCGECPIINECTFEDKNL